MDERELPPDYFASTRWTIVRRAGGMDGAAAAALEELCRTYRKPVWQFIVARTGNAETAEDMVQDYFADLLRRGYLAHANEKAGKFRAFLCADVKLFLANARRKAEAEKRGGKAATVSLDDGGCTAGVSAAAEPAPTDALFDRHWALEVFDLGRSRLRDEYIGKQAVYEALEPLLDKPGGKGIYDDAAARLGMSEGSLKVALHRMRERLGKHLLEIVSDTVGSPTEARGELRYLFQALSFQDADGSHSKQGRPS
jgi:DNA-directed RNA polymerase specialized sigma24 family protein